MYQIGIKGPSDDAVQSWDREGEKSRCSQDEVALRSAEEVLDGPEVVQLGHVGFHLGGQVSLSRQGGAGAGWVGLLAALWVSGGEMAAAGGGADGQEAPCRRGIEGGVDNF